MPRTIAMPALLTRMSIPPSAEVTCSTIFATAAACDTSAAIAIARPPLRLISATTASASPARSR